MAQSRQGKIQPLSQQFPRSNKFYKTALLLHQSIRQNKYVVVINLIKLHTNYIPLTPVYKVEQVHRVINLIKLHTNYIPLTPQSIRQNKYVVVINLIKLHTNYIPLIPVYKVEQEHRSNKFDKTAHKLYSSYPSL